MESFMDPTKRHELYGSHNQYDERPLRLLDTFDHEDSESDDGDSSRTPAVITWVSWALIVACVAATIVLVWGM